MTAAVAVPALLEFSELARRLCLNDSSELLEALAEMPDIFRVTTTRQGLEAALPSGSTSDSATEGSSVFVAVNLTESERRLAEQWRSDPRLMDPPSPVVSSHSGGSSYGFGEEFEATRDAEHEQGPPPADSWAGVLQEGW
eukprot:GHVU01138609.1.p1 GENE.GHVU01138609.1~~GHVU01138609.1.p1  ORF type:complete len:147 (+),score=32.54 GHVU01138609.1:23-442(+)